MAFSSFSLLILSSLLSHNLISRMSLTFCLVLYCFSPNSTIAPLHTDQWFFSFWSNYLSSHEQIYWIWIFRKLYDKEHKAYDLLLYSSSMSIQYYWYPSSTEYWKVTDYLTIQSESDLNTIPTYWPKIVIFAWSVIE